MTIARALEELRTVAAKLNAASDQLNETINTYEAALVESGIGLNCWLEDEVCSPWELGFAKIDHEWRLAVRELTHTETTGGWRTDSGSPIPLIRAPRHVRVAAAERFELLAKVMTERGTKYLEDLECADSTLNKEIG